MNWVYNGSPVTDEDVQDYVGFVYLIENLKTGRKYIGKKLLAFTRTKKVKGKKKKVKIPSDWQTYYGSNNELCKDVEVLGEQYFSRTILHFCRSKGTCSYLEMKEQILHNVLESKDFYNDQIRARVHRSHLKLDG